MPVNKAALKIDWATYAAAKYACEKWHYSRRLPMPPLVKIGVWEESVFIGVVLYGRGANNSIGKEFSLSNTQACELVRVALNNHKTAVSRIVSISLDFLKNSSLGLRMVVSYADPAEGHYGGIYQAMNWLYLGMSMGSPEFYHDGRWKHNREVTAGAFGGKRKIADISLLPKRKTQGKHKYVLPLDDETRAKVLPFAKPYPKRPKQAMTGSTGTAEG